MAFSKSVIAVVLMALLACAAAQGPETTGEAGQAGRALKTIGFGHIGLGHLGWFNNYHTYQHHGGRSYRYVIYKSNKCYDEDWCGHSRKICFDEHYDECDCNYRHKKHHYFRC